MQTPTPHPLTFLNSMNPSLCQSPSCPPTEVAPTTQPTRRPRFDVQNTGESQVVRIELPGVSKEEVRLHLADGVVHLTAERRQRVPETWKPLHRELSDAGYELRLRLNEHLDDSRLSACLQEGILTLTLPFKEAVKPREITVQ